MTIKLRKWPDRVPRVWDMVHIWGPVEVGPDPVTGERGNNVETILPGVSINRLTDLMEISLKR